jgi:hypothetical protein
MNKTFALLGAEFEYSCYRTPQYLEFHRTFKRQLTKELNKLGAEQIEIGKPNHFDVSGFFSIKNQIWYFSLSDLRWSKSDILVRKAQSFKDYTGGMNHFIRLDNSVQFINDLTRLVS